jgi:hypothetical protein
MNTTLKAIALTCLLLSNSCQKVVATDNDQVVASTVADESMSDSASLSLTGAANSINTAAKQAAAALLREVRYTTRNLTQPEIDRALDSIFAASEVVAGRSPLSNLLCLPSTSKPGKYCLKSVDGNPTCVGNYFDSGEICRESLANSRDGRACFQSSSKPGKALISDIAPVSALIGNYYPNIDSCNRSMQQAYGPLVCMASAKFAGKWFIANLDNSAAQVGGYVDTLDECIATFALD